MNATTTHEACLYIGKPAYWRVEGGDYVLFPDHEKRVSETEPSPLSMAPLDEYLLRDGDYDVNCMRAPYLPAAGDALESSFGPNTPPFFVTGCMYEKYLHGGLQRRDHETGGLATWLGLEEGRWELVTTVDYTLPREERCAVLPNEREASLPSARDQCLILGGP